MKLTKRNMSDLLLDRMHNKKGAFYDPKSDFGFDGRSLKGATKQREGQKKRRCLFWFLNPANKAKWFR